MDGFKARAAVRVYYFRCPHALIGLAVSTSTSCPQQGSRSGTVDRGSAFPAIGGGSADLLHDWSHSLCSPLLTGSPLLSSLPVPTVSLQHMGLSDFPLWFQVQSPSKHHYAKFKQWSRLIMLIPEGFKSICISISRYKNRYKIYNYSWPWSHGFWWYIPHIPYISFIYLFIHSCIYHLSIIYLPIYLESIHLSIFYLFIYETTQTDSKFTVWPITALISCSTVFVSRWCCEYTPVPTPPSAFYSLGAKPKQWPR